MHKCSHCGGGTKLIHRTFLQRLRYLAVLQCGECGKIEPQPYLFLYHSGEYVRCPRCGTYRIRRLKKPDRIDPFYRSLPNTYRRLLGGSVFHCRYCRIQFYDRRALRQEVPANEAPAQ